MQIKYPIWDTFKHFLMSKILTLLFFYNKYQARLARNIAKRMWRHMRALHVASGAGRPHPSSARPGVYCKYVADLFPSLRQAINCRRLSGATFVDYSFVKRMSCNSAGRNPDSGNDYYTLFTREHYLYDLLRKAWHSRTEDVAPLYPRGNGSAAVGH